MFASFLLLLSAFVSRSAGGYLVVTPSHAHGLTHKCSLKHKKLSHRHKSPDSEGIMREVRGLRLSQDLNIVALCHFHPAEQIVRLKTTQESSRNTFITLCLSSLLCQPLFLLFTIFTLSLFLPILDSLIAALISSSPSLLPAFTI